MQRRWRRERHKRHPTLSIRPTFPSYLFARPPIAVRLRDARPLVVAEQLAEVRDAEIERLQQVEFLIDEAEKFKRKPRPAHGALVHAKTALLGDVTGTIISSGGGNSTIELAGSGLRLTVPSALVEAGPAVIPVPIAA
jgi:hypothetical protein